MASPAPEFAYLAHLFDDTYRPAVLDPVGGFDWVRFERLVRLNKVELLAYDALFAGGGPEMSANSQEYRQRFEATLEHRRTEFAKLGRSLTKAARLLRGTPYVIVKTFRPFPYFTHDIDVVVRDIQVAAAAVAADGLPWDEFPPGDLHVDWNQGLEIEIYRRILPGPLQVVDDDFAYAGATERIVEGVPVQVAGPEVEIMTLLADAAFRLYELKLGDIVYIYTLADDADWSAMARQAARYRWRAEFEHLVQVLNGYHRLLYGEPGPMESAVHGVVPARAWAPYVTPFGRVLRGFSRQGARHLMRLPAYLSVVLKQNHPTLHRFYIAAFMAPVGGFVVRRWYRW